ncbi:hypothetical protein L208DRAFT_102988 [Tricholoma matsutake]|nr:hypothetical protein L208DRAFT_102988 [Tricholoma matsutake 945]
MQLVTICHVQFITAMSSSSTLLVALLFLDQVEALDMIKNHGFACPYLILSACQILLLHFTFLLHVVCLVLLLSCFNAVMIRERDLASLLLLALTNVNRSMVFTPERRLRCMA